MFYIPVDLNFQIRVSHVSSELSKGRTAVDILHLLCTSVRLGCCQLRFCVVLCCVVVAEWL